MDIAQKDRQIYRKLHYICDTTDKVADKFTGTGNVYDLLIVR